MPTSTLSPSDACADPRVGLPSGLRHRGISSVDDVLDTEFLRMLATITDPRAARGTRYPLVALLAIALCAVAAGASSFIGIGIWARCAPRHVLAALAVRFRRPDEKTFRAVFARLDTDAFDATVGAYFAALPATRATADPVLRAVSVDGKTLRGARAGGSTAPHLVSMVTHDTHLTIGQVAVADKSNEIPAARTLLRKSHLTGVVYTVDAMHTQTKIAKLICHRLRSQYVMIVKRNQPSLLDRVTALPWDRIPVTFTEPVERHHGRIEHRSLKTSTVPRGIGFPYARQVFEITRTRSTLDGANTTVEVVYGLCSLPFEQAPPRTVAAWIRGHWGIENRSHYVRDVTFGEDRSTVRVGQAPRMMASIRNTVVNLHRLAGETNIAEACQKAAYNITDALDLFQNRHHPSSQRC